MNQSFLETVAAAINQRFEKQLHRIVLVFPNRRQSVFFKNFLQQIITPPAFLPELLTIEELVQRSAIYPVASHFVQSFELYDAYAEIMERRGEKKLLDYEKFYTLGDIILRDFQELDVSLCDIPQVYEQLKDIEAIQKSFDVLTEGQREFLQSFWSSFSAEKRSVQQQKFLELWEMLPAIYNLYHQKLMARQLTTQGQAYRQLAAGQPGRTYFADAWLHIAFVGFNAFNKAEETVLARWQQQGKASLWMDADAHYTNHPLHEAGHFIRRNMQLQLQNELPLLQHLKQAETPMHVIAAEGAVAQTKLLSRWLNKYYSASSSETVAIILADESLLLPVLQSLPPEAGNVNVTMGYPLQQSVYFSFIQLFFNIQTDLAIHRQRDVGFEPVQAFLQHPLCDWSDTVKQNLQRRLVDEVLLRVPLYYLQGHTDIGNYFFSPLHQPTDIFDRLISITESLHRSKYLQNDLLLQGLLLQVWETIRQLKQLFTGLPPSQLSLAFLAQCLRKQLATLTVPFEGEPLKGIQVMGLLESRGLDFDHIIVLNANEGSLPRVQSSNSFLPYSIRRAFGLSVPEHQDAIFAYAFYRLLHRCQTITMVYNSTNNDQNTGELTRFVAQLEFETKFNIVKSNIRFALKANTPKNITIQKTQEVLQLCNPYFQPESPKTISPSAINSYINCQLQFYFRYIARLKEPDEIQDEVDAAVFGNIVHNLMELLYLAVKKKNGHWKITRADITWMKSQIPELLQQAFIEGWRTKTKQPIVFTGRLLVIAEVVKQYANAYLSYDATNTPFEIEALETDFKEAFPITVNGRERKIYFSGYIDRVDILKGVYRMVDYKTGSDELEFSSVQKIFDRQEKKRNKAALQTFVYAWSFSKKYPEKSRFEPVLLPLRQMEKMGEDFTPHFSTKDADGERQYVNASSIHGVLNEMEIHLRTTLEELFDRNVPFAQTTDPDKCTYCPYIAICGRE